MMGKSKVPKFIEQNDMRWRIEHFSQKARSKLPDEMERHLFPNKYPDENGYPEPIQIRKREIYDFDEIGVPSEHDQPTLYHDYLNQKNEKYTAEQLAKTTFMPENKLFFDPEVNKDQK